ncbi:hypothetical protein [Burkholderia pyrrocinia]|uniref:hypothetical protein n=1 Tax=Burkholderia pyrrocinia TaxID=60550 RepID=UPI0010461665|nr:hypothetical protein [Burkholderia pyrrocinia]TDA45729.1 hypothetical protein EVG18_19680 [Burkholderia pyrrocinia]
MAFVQYDGGIRLANGYKNTVGNTWANGYLGVGQSVQNGSGDVVGAYATTTNHDKQTKWTISKVASSGSDGLVYSGDQVTLKNGFDGTYLGMFTNNQVDNGGYKLQSFTSTSVPGVTINWTVFKYSAQPKTNDSRLSDADVIYLVATFSPGTGTLSGILDTNGYGASQGFQYLVTGARLLNRDNGSGLWQVFAL